MSALGNLTARLPLARMRPRAEALVAIGVGVLCFGLAFLILAFIQARDVPDATLPPEAGGIRPQASLAERIASDKVAVGVPSSAQDVLLSETRPGDRLDIIALLGGRPGEAPLTAVVVRGATVLSAPTGNQGGPALLEVSPEEAVVLGHLTQGGVRLTYALWSSR